VPWEICTTNTAGITITLPVKANCVFGDKVGVLVWGQGTTITVATGAGDTGCYFSGSSTFSTSWNQVGIVYVEYTADGNGNWFTDRYPFGAVPGQLVDFRQKAGPSTGAYSAAYTAAVNPLPDGSGGNMQLTYTPPVNCYWETTFGVGQCVKNDAAYGVAYLGVVLAPVDANGYVTAWDVKTQHSSVNQIEARFVHRTFTLVAGTAYTLNAALSVGSGSWTLWLQQDYYWLQAKAIAR
jgi:hypothetical protein